MLWIAPEWVFNFWSDPDPVFNPTRAILTSTNGNGQERGAEFTAIEDIVAGRSHRRRKPRGVKSTATVDPVGEVLYWHVNDGAGIIGPKTAHPGVGANSAICRINVRETPSKLLHPFSNLSRRLRTLRPTAFEGSSGIFDGFIGKGHFGYRGDVC
ncbi:MAG: hypothetical protein JSR98_09695 [Proteobacteria bacterium]|nr:hypothetical protein [Pseudomonadota bacterium]